MSGTIREQIIAALVQKLTEIRTTNGYVTDIGALVERVRPIFQPAEVPAISVTPQMESAQRMYGEIVANMSVKVEGFMKHETDNPSVVAEKILGDLISCLTEMERSLAFTSGGTYEVKPGDIITGATSGVTARVVEVTVTSGTWAGGDAAGTLRLRLQSGSFVAENLDVGVNSDVATISGNSTLIRTNFGGLILDIHYIGGGPDNYPESGEEITGCPAVFLIKYRTAFQTTQYF